MKKLIFLSMIISLLFSSNTLTRENMGIHKHVHTHTKGSPVSHEHIHIDSNYPLFLNTKENKGFFIFVSVNYFEIKKIILNPIIDKVLRPPIF